MTPAPAATATRTTCGVFPVAAPLMAT